MDATMCNRKLAIDAARAAGKEHHRHEYGCQYGRHPDDRAADLRHGLEGRLARRQPVFAHDAVDVFHDHDRVVDQNADRQHQSQTT